MAWLVKYQDGSQEVVYSNPCNLHPDYSDIPTSVTPLYTAPQPKHEWISLTTDEVSIIEHEVYGRTVQKGKPMSVFIAQFAKAIESTLKGKNSHA